ncbi:MAG: chromophore lyase CpcT/CpeT [Cyanophyceae cyanobacterium]
MSLPSIDDLTRLAHYLAGDFSNQEQAWENPPLYAQIQVCYAPLPWAILDTYGFYVEQAYSGHLQDPYRTAVVALALDEQGLIIRNYRPLAPERWQGSPRQDPSRLAAMRAEDMGPLPGCDVQVFCQDGVFGGETQPGRHCRVVRQGQPSYLHTTVEISPEQLVTHDRGFDPETHEQVWGALAGPFVFRKIADWSAHLPTPA